MKQKKPAPVITKDMALRQKGPNWYAFVRGSLQVGLPLATLLSIGMPAYRWGWDLSHWVWPSVTLTLAVNFTLIPVLAFFLGRAFYYGIKKKQP